MHLDICLPPASCCLLFVYTGGTDTATRRGGAVGTGPVRGLRFGLQGQLAHFTAPAAGGAEFLRVALEPGHVIIEDELLLVKQTADQSRLAVIDRAAGQYPQRRTRFDGGRGPQQ